MIDLPETSPIRSTTRRNTHPTSTSAQVNTLKHGLAPDVIKGELVLAGCFLSAYELIKSEVVDKVHDFFWCGFEDGKHLHDEAQYQQDVIALHPKSQYRASCAWLVKMQALSKEQVATLEEIYRHRKEIAHELPKLLVDPDFSVNTDLLLAAVECVRALGVFWGSIEVSINPDFDGQEINDEDIKSGSYVLMEYLMSIADLPTAVPVNQEDSTDSAT